MDTEKELLIFEKKVREAFTGVGCDIVGLDGRTKKISERTDELVKIVKNMNKKSSKNAILLFASITALAYLGAKQCKIIVENEKKIKELEEKIDEICYVFDSNLSETGDVDGLGDDLK